MKIAVLGAGAWGTALAVAAAARHDVLLWARSADQAAAIGRERVNGRYLPGFRLNPAVQPTTDLAGAVIGATVGGAAGGAIGKDVNAKEGMELVLRMESGEVIAVVQEADIAFVPGQKIRVITRGRVSRVVPAN